MRVKEEGRAREGWRDRDGQTDNRGREKDSKSGGEGGGE